MDGINLGDLVQFGIAAPFCWLWWQTDNANRAEREKQRIVNERMAIALELLVMGITNRPLAELTKERRDVQ